MTFVVNSVVPVGKMSKIIAKGYSSTEDSIPTDIGTFNKVIVKADNEVYYEAKLEEAPIGGKKPAKADGLN